jgi:hypothetical protein
MRITLNIITTPPPWSTSGLTYVYANIGMLVCTHRSFFCEAGDSKGIKNPHLSRTFPTPVLPLCIREQSAWIPTPGPAAPLISRTWMPCLAAIRGLEITLVSTLSLLDCSRCHVLLRPTPSTLRSLASRLPLADELSRPCLSTLDTYIALTGGLPGTLGSPLFPLVCSFAAWGQPPLPGTYGVRFL